MKSRFLAFAAFLVAALALPIGQIEACGPWFEPEVFVDKSGPGDLAAFADGRLGILQAGFDSNEYAVAYRYLNGGKLSAAERSAYAPPTPRAGIMTDYRHFTPDQIYEAQEAAKKARMSEQPAGQWLRARKIRSHNSARYPESILPDRLRRHHRFRRKLPQLPRRRIQQRGPHP